MNSESTVSIWPTACAGGRRNFSRASSGAAAKGTSRWAGAVDVGREAFTEIDRAIAEHSSPDGTVRLPQLLAAPEGVRLACLDRLQTLEEMQLVTKASANVWRLAEGWKEYLVQRGEDLDARVRLRRLVGADVARYQVLRPENPVPVANGVVVGIGLHDELTGDLFAAVETAGGRGYYVRLPHQAAEMLKEKDAVRIGFEVEPWLKPADRIVARFAQENGGTYDPVRHQRALEGLRQTAAAHGQPSPADRVAANVRRLERLARYRLATRLPDGRWQIPPAFSANSQGASKRIRSADSVSKKLAGGAAEPVRPRAPEAPFEREREALGQAIANRNRLTYVPEPVAFSGRCVPCKPTSSSAEFVGVVDELRRQFTLIPKAVCKHRLDGRVVSLGRDAAGRLVIEVGPELSR